MRPVFAAFVAAIELVAIALAAWVLLAVPCFLLWSLNFSLDAEPAVVLGVSVALWLLTFGVPLQAELPAELARSMGLADTALSVSFSLVPLGLALLACWFIARATWRSTNDGATGFGSLAGVTIAAAIVAGVAASYAADLLGVTRVGAVVIVCAVVAVAGAIGVLWRAIRDEHEWWDWCVRRMIRLLDRVGVVGAAAYRQRAAEVMRLVAALTLAIVALSSVATVTSLVVGYPQVIALAQGLQLDPWGAIFVFVIELIFLPTFIVWAFSWLTGAGFAVGEGSILTPFETLQGPLPALPVFGALPASWGVWGVLAPALVFILGVIVGALWARGPRVRRWPMPVIALMVCIAAITVGLIVRLAVWVTSGAIGPDRLEFAGPAVWSTTFLTVAELGVGTLLGVCAMRLDTSRLREQTTTLGARIRDLPTQAVPGTSRSAAPRDETHDPDGEAEPVGPVAPSEPPIPMGSDAAAEPRDSLASSEPAVDEVDNDDLVEAYLWDADEVATKETQGDDESGRRPGASWRNRLRRD